MKKDDKTNCSSQDFGVENNNLIQFDLVFQVSKLSGVLSQLGVQRGDVVLIYMPMIPEAVEAMLATVRLGGIHAVVFGGKLRLVKAIFIRPEEVLFFRQFTRYFT